MDTNTKQQVVDALQGSQIGAIVACAIGVDIPAPKFTSKAIVTSDGFLQANFVDRDGITRHSAFVGDYSDLKSNMQSVLRYLRKLEIIDEDQSSGLFNAVVFDWIVTDYRS